MREKQFSDVDGPAQIDTIAARIVASCADPFVLLGTTVAVTASVGIAFSSQAIDTPTKCSKTLSRRCTRWRAKGAADHQVIDLHDQYLAAEGASLERGLHGAPAREARLLRRSGNAEARSVFGILTGRQWSRNFRFHRFSPNIHFEKNGE